jgi:hypothetical protein
MQSAEIKSAIAAVQSFQPPPPPAEPPAHLRGTLAQAAGHGAEAASASPPPAPDGGGLLRRIVFRSPSGGGVRSSPAFLSTLCGDVRASASEPQLRTSVQALLARLQATGAYRGVGAELVLPQEDAPAAAAAASASPDLLVTLDELTFSATGGSSAGMRGEFASSAQVTLVNALGYAETVSGSVGGDVAALSFGVGGADGASVLGGLMSGGGLQLPALVPAQLASNWQLRARKPTLGGTPASLELQLRRSSAPLSLACSLVNSVVEGEVALTDASGVHSLAVGSALRQLAPLRPAGYAGRHATLNSPEVLPHCLASVKNSLTYAAALGALAPSPAVPASGAAACARLEVASLGGGAFQAKASLAGTWAASLWRYTPDTGYRAPSDEGSSSSGSSGGSPLKPFPGAAGVLPWFISGGSGAGGSSAGSSSAHWMTERLAQWMSPGVTLAVDGMVGYLQPLGGGSGGGGGGAAAAAAAAPVAAGARGTPLCDRFFVAEGGRYLRGFSSLGPRGSAVAERAAGVPPGDALGGDAVAAVTARLLLPPPVPLLVEQGLRSYLFASVGASALHAGNGGGGVAALARALAVRPSACYGVGVVRVAAAAAAAAAGSARAPWSPLLPLPKPPPPPPPVDPAPPPPPPGRLCQC